jgi:YfiH family protein
VPGLVHGISTRELEAGRAPAGPDEDLPALAPLLDRLGWRGDPPVRPRQVHGAAVIRAEEVTEERPEADAAVTGRAGVMLSVRVADCLPLILAPRGGGAVAVVHAGWRGLAAGVLERGVEELLAVAGGDPRELVAAVGPGIGRCCFEVGPEVVEAVAPSGATAARPGPRGRPMLDLRAVAVERLLALGLPPEAVDGEAPCTACGGALLHSYRRDGEKAGRLVAVAGYAVSMT